jgi:sodium/hydrogen exchanger 8
VGERVQKFWDGIGNVNERNTQLNKKEKRSISLSDPGMRKKKERKKERKKGRKKERKKERKKDKPHSSGGAPA